MALLLHQSIEESAERDPHHEAFRFQGGCLTYECLVRRAHQVAAVLTAEGVRPGDRVGIYMLKGLELPSAVYGILRAGGAYVPIDPATPAARIKFIVEDCGIRHIVTDGSRARRLQELLPELPQVRTVVGASATASDASPTRCIPWEHVATAGAPPAVRVTEQDLAYIMYTSGSTGAPKGLMHTHASGLTYARLSARTYGVTAADRLGNHSPLHFDMSTFEFLTGPLCGATTVLVPEETAMFPVSLGSLIESERLTFWYSVPLALIQLVTHDVVDRMDARSLRWVLFGGEPFPPKYLSLLMERWPNARFSNVYGPAEVNQCTFYHVPREDSGSADPIPIGRAWDNTECLVVGADGAPVAPGVIGELLVRSPTMMHGYWGRPDLNATAFHDVEAYPGFRKRYYRTGDLVRERPDGNLVFVGRKDRQVKVRGYRVELDELESVLASFEAVAEAAAFVVRQGVEAHIVAAVVLRGDCSARELQRGVAERLPAYAVPHRVEIRSTFPRTGSGKIDRRALAALYEADSA